MKSMKELEDERNAFSLLNRLGHEELVREVICVKGMLGKMDEKIAWVLTLPSRETLWSRFNEIINVCDEWEDLDLSDHDLVDKARDGFHRIHQLAYELKQLTEHIPQAQNKS